LTRHFRNNHTEEAYIRRKKQEQRIAKALERAGIHFKREQRISFTCFKNTGTQSARIDFYIDIHLKCIIFLEVDEKQHKYGYAIGCDMARMSHVLTALRLEGNTLPILFVRYNPHAYRLDGHLQRTLKKDREAQLVQFLTTYKPLTSGSIDIAYMFYDSETLEDGSVSPTLTHNDEYNTTMKQCIRHVLV